MIYRISQYIQPWEIDDLDRQIDQHIKSSYYIQNNEIIFDITMNLEIVNWDNSSLPIDYFINKFKYLQTKLSQYYKANFDTDPNIKGCTDKRRQSQFKEQDFIIWLDSDLYFSHLTLPYLVHASQQISDEYFIISPEIIKYWDHSWDCITHNKFLNEPHNHRDYFDLYSLEKLVSENEITVRKNNTIKFGGGWFNLIKNSVFNKVPLIDELGSYAPDDTYLSFCGESFTSQYILGGVVVSEIGKRFLENKNYIKPLLDIKIQDKQKITDQELYNLINTFRKNYNI
jgi:hypothetical protein